VAVFHFIFGFVSYIVLMIRRAPPLQRTSSQSKATRNDHIILPCPRSTQLGVRWSPESGTAIPDTQCIASITIKDECLSYFSATEKEITGIVYHQRSPSFLPSL